MGGNGLVPRRDARREAIVARRPAFQLAGFTYPQSRLPKPDEMSAPAIVANPAQRAACASIGGFHRLAEPMSKACGMRLNELWPLGLSPTPRSGFQLSHYSSFCGSECLPL